MRASEFINEMPLPADWDPKAFSTDKQDKTTFKSRLKYALERSKKLGQGSARVAMTIEYQGRPTALKIAKNKKGMAQNEFEVSILQDGYYGQSELVIPMIDFDHVNPVPVWVQTELAMHADERRLCNLLKCQTLRQLIDCANSKIGKGFFGVRDERVRMVPDTCKLLAHNGFTEQEIEMFLHYVDEMASLGTGDVILNDLVWPANWGIYQGKPVIIDLGFSTSVSQKYYRQSTDDLTDSW